MDELIQSYRSLRAMLEDAVASWPTDSNTDIRSAIYVYLKTHCKDCGEVIPEQLRRTGSTRCWWCSQPPRPAIRQGLNGENESEAGDDDVPFR